MFRPRFGLEWRLGHIPCALQAGASALGAGGGEEKEAEGGIGGTAASPAAECPEGTPEGGAAPPPGLLSRPLAGSAPGESGPGPRSARNELEGPRSRMQRDFTPGLLINEVFTD